MKISVFSQVWKALAPYADAQSTTLLYHLNAHWQWVNIHACSSGAHRLKGNRNVTCCMLILLASICFIFENKKKQKRGQFKVYTSHQPKFRVHNTFVLYMKKAK